MVNKRNQSTYDSTTNIQSEHYTVDRWYKTPQSKVMYSVTYGTCKLYNMTTTTMAGVGQYIEKHKELLGKTVTFTLGTGIGEFSTTFDVPADTSTLTANTVLHTETTTFGAIQFEWHTEHFFINILMNPLTDTSDTTYLLLKYAKLELGTVFTGLEDIDKVEETALCAKFYERFIYDSCWLSAICTRTATSTTYEIHMRYTPKRVKPSLKNNTSNRIQVCLTNETPAYVNCSSSGHSSCENNNSMSTVTLSRDEDNSAIMGDKEVISEWCAVKFRSFDFDAEIYK